MRRIKGLTIIAIFTVTMPLWAVLLVARTSWEIAAVMNQLLGDMLD